MAAWHRIAESRLDSRQRQQRARASRSPAQWLRAVVWAGRGAQPLRRNSSASGCSSTGNKQSSCGHRARRQDLHQTEMANDAAAYSAALTRLRRAVQKIPGSVWPDRGPVRQLGKLEWFVLHMDRKIAAAVHATSPAMIANGDILAEFPCFQPGFDWAGYIEHIKALMQDRGSQECQRPFLKTHSPTTAGSGRFEMEVSDVGYMSEWGSTPDRAPAKAQEEDHEEAAVDNAISRRLLGSPLARLISASPLPGLFRQIDASKTARAAKFSPMQRPARASEYLYGHGDESYGSAASSGSTSAIGQRIPKGSPEQVVEPDPLATPSTQTLSPLPKGTPDFMAVLATQGLTPKRFDMSPAVSTGKAKQSTNDHRRESFSVELREMEAQLEEERQQRTQQLRADYAERKRKEVVAAIRIQAAVRGNRGRALANAAQVAQKKLIRTNTQEFDAARIKLNAILEANPAMPTEVSISLKSVIDELAKDRDEIQQ